MAFEVNHQDVKGCSGAIDGAAFPIISYFDFLRRYDANPLALYGLVAILTGMTDARSSFEKVLELMHLASERMSEIDGSPWDFGTGVPMHRAEIHTVRAIGENPGINVTRLAGILNVTKGAVSQMAARLAKKGMIVKARSGGNAREVRMDLTALGRRGFRTHQEFHERMFTAVKAWFGPRFESRMTDFQSVMKDLDGILEDFARKGVRP